METSVQNQSPPAGGEIACIAYGLWERAGRPSGRDIEFWLEAERQITAPPQDSATQAAARQPARPQATEPNPTAWSPVVLAKGNTRNPARNASRQPDARARRAASA